MTVIRITPDTARAYLVAQSGMAQPLASGPASIPDLLAARRCIQLDPLDRIGTNADMVASARLDGIRKGDVYQALLPGHAFEHFAKERCLLPGSAFPYYRNQAHSTPWWRAGVREQRLTEDALSSVLAEVRERGPVAMSQLADRGRVEPMDWSGWKGTGKVTTMAIEVLWRRCEIVVCGRTSEGKVFDVPERALPTFANLAVTEPFGHWAIRERVAAAGLLARATGPWWSMLAGVRKEGVADAMVARGELVELTVEGSRRTYFAPPDWRDRPSPEPDDRMRIVAPLDPLIWDRKLVEHVFGFAYVWEVYKPAHKRRWGWYVCPLLHRGQLVGRIEARVEGDALVVDRVWREHPQFDDDALNRALERHAVFLGLVTVAHAAA